MIKHWQNANGHITRNDNRLLRGRRSGKTERWTEKERKRKRKREKEKEKETKRTKRREVMTEYRHRL